MHTPPAGWGARLAARSGVQPARASARGVPPDRSGSSGARFAVRRPPGRRGVPGRRAGAGHGRGDASLRAMLADVAKHDWSPFIGTLSLTMSPGATAGQPLDTHSTLLARADHNLYAAKSAGRNRLVVDRLPPGGPPAFQTCDPLPMRSDLGRCRDRRRGGGALVAARALAGRLPRDNLGAADQVPSGSSSVGRASAFQAECRGFETRLPLQSPCHAQRDTQPVKLQQE